MGRSSSGEAVSSRMLDALILAGLTKTLGVSMIQAWKKMRAVLALLGEQEASSEQATKLQLTLILAI